MPKYRVKFDVEAKAAMSIIDDETADQYTYEVP